MMVKSMSMIQHVDDLQETFATLQEHNMRLNPTKYTLGVASSKFLGFIISQRGIKANPEKISAVLELSPPRTIAEVQYLTGNVVALSRFVSKSAERCLHFFKTLRRAQDFHWNEDFLQVTQRVPHLFSPTYKSKPRGQSVSLFGRLHHSSKLGTSTRRRHHAKAYILC